MPWTRTRGSSASGAATRAQTRRSARSAARRSTQGPGQRLGLARGAAPAGHDGDPVRQQHLPGRGRDRPRRRDRPRGRATRSTSSTTSCCGRTTRCRCASLPLTRRLKRSLGRHAVHHQRGARAGPRRVLARRDAASWSCCRCTRAWSSTCASTRSCSRRTHVDYSYVRIKGLREHPVRRQGHVHGPVRHRRARRAC